MQEAVTNITNSTYGSVNGLAQGHTVTRNERVSTGDPSDALDSARRFLDGKGPEQLRAVLDGGGDGDETTTTAGA
ncbi:hypothetical protein O5Y58_16745 [Microbacterium paraoxydans]|uniref:hypothetical protein n=1 Tax=Microbacterium paraoxydans TaxID=199592 RepID=UPI00352D143D